MLLLISRMLPELGAPGANASVGTCVPPPSGASDGVADGDNEGWSVSSTDGLSVKAVLGGNVPTSTIVGRELGTKVGM